MYKNTTENHQEKIHGRPKKPWKKIHGKIHDRNSRWNSWPKSGAGTLRHTHPARQKSKPRARAGSKTSAPSRASSETIQFCFFAFALQKPVWIRNNPTSQYFYSKIPSAGLGTLNSQSKGLSRITFCKGLAPLHENVAFFPWIIHTLKTKNYCLASRYLAKKKKQQRQCQQQQ